MHSGENTSVAGWVSTSGVPRVRTARRNPEALLEEALVYFAYLFAVGQEVQAVLREAMETRGTPAVPAIMLMAGLKEPVALLLRANQTRLRWEDGA